MVIAFFCGCTQVSPVIRHAPVARGTLLVTDSDVQTAREKSAADAQLQQVAATLQKSADRLLNDPAVERKLIGPRLLSVSKEAQRRIWLLAGMYRWTGDQKYADRAVIELRAVCRFSDWNPSHFLDVAEMCAAVSVGYDWLYGKLSDDDRLLIRRAIATKALLPAIDACKHKVWWTTCDINWAQVCSGGLVMGAIAIRDEEPALASKIFELTKVCIERPMHVYAPDGGYKEGAGYWNYGTRFNVLYFAALQSALHYESPLMSMEGFDKTGFFRIHTIGPSGKLFNYADCNEPPGNASHLFWLARQFHQPMFAQFERDYAKTNPDILHLFWWNQDRADLSKLPTAVKFEKAGVVCMRSGWDKNAMYIGIKAGTNNFGHAHLDLGSFVLDCDGERWAIDLGSDDYNLPGYFGEKRWEYYRLRTEGHNVIDFAGRSQAATAVAETTPFDPTYPYVRLKLSNVYSNPAPKWERIVYAPKQIVLMADSFVPDAGVRWVMHTKAAVSLSADGRIASLQQNGKTLLLAVRTANLKMLVEDVNVAAPQKSAQGIRRIVINLAKSTGNVTVSFSRNKLTEGHDQLLIPTED